MMNKKIIVNIGRQLGSGGREIGAKLAARLGIDFYDKELIRLASEQSGLRSEFFEKADERASQTVLGGLFGMRFPFIGDGAMPAGNCLSNDSLFQVQSDVIRHLAQERSCLFVGRGHDGEGGQEALGVLQLLQQQDVGRRRHLPPVHRFVGAGRGGHDGLHRDLRPAEAGDIKVEETFVNIRENAYLCLRKRDTGASETHYSVVTNGL